MKIKWYEERFCYWSVSCTVNLFSYHKPNGYTGISELSPFEEFKRSQFIWWTTYEPRYLIGTDFYHTFFTDEIIRGKSNEPVALSSHFGWDLSGNYKVN